MKEQTEIVAGPQVFTRITVSVGTVRFEVQCREGADAVKELKDALAACDLVKAELKKP